MSYIFRKLTANVRPPPKNNVYNHIIKIMGVQVHIEDAKPHLFTAPSPINPEKAYYEFNIFYANSVDFGVRMLEKSMSVMQTVQARDKVQVTLSLRDRKELDIQFPHIIDNESRNLRFHLPLSLVEVIYKVFDKETDQDALIIPFDTPPKFYVQVKVKDIGKTCKMGERIWIAWNTWYRQTDIISRKTRDQLQVSPVMSRKDGAIIDIGKIASFGSYCLVC